MRAGRTLGIVGESGSGKSVTARALMQLVDPPGRITGGSIRLGEIDIAQLPRRGEAIRAIRGADISMIFQEPMSSLSPVHTIGAQVMEVLELHLKLDRKAARARTIELLGQVEIPNPEQAIDRYAYEFSGGMRQRAMIAMALACNPRVLIADEPTTALDVTIQAQILELLQDLQEEYRMGTVIITHDLGVVSSFTDRVMIMYAGQVVEAADAESVFGAPRHPYTEGLLASIPSSEQDTERLYAIPGTVPPPFDLPPGCRFEPRCAYAREPCREAPPPLIPCGPGHLAACIRNTGYRFPEGADGGR